MTEIIPAIDLSGGRVVRLTKGDYGSVKEYGRDPAEWARRYADCGARRLHLVDLDGAKSAAPVNLPVLEKIASLTLGMTLEWGGGIKDRAALASVWEAGADAAVIGSLAVREPGTVRDWLAEWGGRIVLGADIRDGKVATDGWLRESGATADGLLDAFIPSGLRRVIVTDIERDGMLGGPSFPLYTGLKRRFPDVEIIVSGGVSGVEDLRRAAELGLDGIIAGKSLYEGKITLEQLRQCLQNG